MDKRTAQNMIAEHPRRIATFTALGKTALVKTYTAQLEEARAFMATLSEPVAPVAPVAVNHDFDAYRGPDTLTHALAYVNGQPVAACTKTAMKDGQPVSGIVNCYRCDRDARSLTAHLGD